MTKNYLTREEIQALRDYQEKRLYITDRESELLFGMAEAYLDACERAAQKSKEYADASKALKSYAPDMSNLLLTIGAEILTVVYGKIPTPEEASE